MIINLIIYTIYFYQKIESTQGCFFFSSFWWCSLHCCINIFCVVVWNNPSSSIDTSGYTDVYEVHGAKKNSLQLLSSLYTFDRNNVQFDSFRANTSKCLFESENFRNAPDKRHSYVKYCYAYLYDDIHKFTSNRHVKASSPLT